MCFDETKLISSNFLFLLLQYFVELLELLGVSVLFLQLATLLLLTVLFALLVFPEVKSLLR